MRDLRHAWRTLTGSPGLAATAGLSIALAIGATTAVFTLVNAMLFKPLPVFEPDWLVAAYTMRTGSTFPDALSYPDYLDYRQDGVFRDLVGHAGVPLSMAGSRARPESSGENWSPATTSPVSVCGRRSGASLRRATTSGPARIRSRS